MELPRGYISYNQISTYQYCPRKYYFSYIDEIKTPFNENTFLGTVFHSTLEYFFSRRIKGAKTESDELIAEFLRRFDSLQEENEVIWKKTRDECRNRGQAFVEYFHGHVAEGINPLMVEKELEIELSELDITLKGIIDLVEQDFSITDFKTASSRWSKSRLQRSLLQMMIYKFLFEKSFGEINSRLKFQILYSGNSRKVGHQKILITPEETDTEKMFDIIRYVVGNIKREIFVKNESYVCGFCDYREICNPKK